MLFRRRIYGAIAALGLVVAIVVFLDVRGITGSFLSDDFAHLHVIAHMDRDHALGAWVLARFVEPLGSGNFAYRPIVFLCYAIEWRLFGAWAAGWRITSLLVHLANIAIVFVVVSRWTSGQTRGLATGVSAAALFAAFPFAGEVTFWPGGRAELLTALFSLLFLASLNGGPGRASIPRQILRIAALIAALLSRESAMPLPVIALFIDTALARAQRSQDVEQQWLASLRFAARDLAPSWIAFAGYLAWRMSLFGTPFKVYPASSPPASVNEYFERLSSFGALLRSHPGLDPPWLWALVAGALSLALVSAWAIGIRERPHAQTLLAGACCLGALVYLFAPALSFHAAAASGEGARNYYVAWIYVSMALGFAAGASRVGSLLGVAAVGWMLVGQHGSVKQWQDAARQMRDVIAAIPTWAERRDPDEYALLLLPDHIGVALFARSAEGSIVDWPIQTRSYLNVAAGMTEPDIPGWRKHFPDGAIAQLKGVPHFDMERFVGVFCWSPAKRDFVQVSAGGPVVDFDAWERTVRSGVGRASCLPGTLEGSP